MTKSIHILNASFLKDDDLRKIALAVELTFGISTAYKRISLDIDSAFDGSRGQYSSSVLLAAILTNHSSEGGKRIAIVDIDLYIPVLTFIFGEAQFMGTAAIVSALRLANQFYGLPRDHRQLVERLEKEIIHELGHTFGLYHCHQFECVMRSSTYVEEIDLKRAQPCPACMNILRNLQSTTSVTSDGERIS